ncbi:hypothetical protein RQP54_16795 [Curvibacter sp. APW13]|uniref:hypothetical protein n=1 Tax=Curvibacter sp. APW13 TaxID=3077236 RepID=UPI0028DF449A|nr:hypothetical protein [Curvibacter sp. APW13]MDT8992531.1 hypothetical protein [Curvibacter sp. APW13]
MTNDNRRSTAGRLLTAVLAAMPLALWAQTPATITQESDWRRANDAVGALKRGHADVLRWEQANPVAQDGAPSTALTALPDAGAAIRLAWQAHPDLVVPLARLGADATQAIVEGRWLGLDPSLQRRIEGMAEVLEVATLARKAWLEAVAARQLVQHRRAMLDATEAAKDLGERMVTVGNWSKLQLAPLTLAHASARMDLRRAQHGADMAQSQLVKALRLTGSASAFALPDQLPAVPTNLVSPAALQTHAEALARQLPGTEARRNQALLRDARKTMETAHALAQDSTEVVLKTREFITEETLLHYNGMLKSVWDLLGEVRNQSQAALEAINAQRDFWLADADLQWVLQGGEPANLVSLNGGAADAPAAAAH